MRHENYKMRRIESKKKHDETRRVEEEEEQQMLLEAQRDKRVSLGFIIILEKSKIYKGARLF